MATDVPTLLFQPGGDGVAVDVPRLVASRMLVQANSGGGKSRALRYMLEQTHGVMQHVVIDPEGEFASLREKFPYLLVGKDGDVPANPKAAKLLARRVMELGGSTVIDLFDLQLGDRRRFVRLFLEELMHLPRSLWHPALIVVDEAHYFAPERGSGEAESAEAMIALASQGRKRGYALVAATQRLSKLHKDVAAELLNKMIGRTGLDVDVKRAGDELGFDKERRAGLKAMAPGTFWVYGPAITNEVTLVRTGEVETTHPEAGDIGVAAPPAPAAVARLVEQLRDLPREAEEEARTVEELQKLNRQLKADLKRAQSAAPAPTIDTHAIERAVAEARASDAKARHREIADIHGRLKAALRPLEQGVSLLDEARLAVEGWASARVAAPPPVLTQRPAAPSPALRPVQPAASTPAHPAASDAAGLSASDLRVLNALAAFEVLGIDQPRRSNVAFFAGYTEGGRFNNLLGSLRTAGYLEYPGSGLVSLTDAGREIADAGAHPVTSLEDLHALWRGKLPDSEWKVLKVLIDAYPDSLTRGELAGATDYTEGGRFNNILGRLRSLGAVDYPSKGVVAATDVLFPEGLA